MPISAYKHIGTAMDYVLIFKALGDETRFRILNLFVQCNQQLCVCEMEDALQLPQYTISKALNSLRHAGLLISGKQGTWVYTQLNQESEFARSFFSLLQNHLKNHYPEDMQRLHKRLSLREDNICVIGVPLQDKLDEEVLKRISTR